MNLLRNIYQRISVHIDLPFILFLLAISPSKVYLKAVALVIIFALRPKFDFSILKKIPLFYPLILLLATIQFFFFNSDFSTDHFIVFFVGCIYWFFCYAYLYQTWIFVNENTFEKINKSLGLFVIINAIVCFYNYFDICLRAHTFFPFLQYPGDFGASTGDYIQGIFGVPSYLNSIINSLFALYFLKHKKIALFFLSSFILLLTFANIINLIFIGILIVYAVFLNDNRRRMYIALNLLLCLSMYKFVSPDNYNYVRKTIGLSVNDEIEIMPEVVIASPKDTSLQANAPTTVKYVNDSSAAKQKILMIDRAQLFHKNYDEFKTYHPVDIKSSPGKKIALVQTAKFLKENPSKAIFGAGMGNFSSRLAYQFSGRDSSRLFMRLPKYCSGYYFQNNLLIYDSMRQLPTEYHSIKHFPNNFLSQLLGEYGVLGLLIFVVFYVYYFFKRAHNKVFIVLLIGCIGSYLMLDYFFEFLNVMVIFELICLIEAKKKPDTHIL